MTKPSIPNKGSVLQFKPQLDGARFCAVFVVLLLHQDFSFLRNTKYFFDLNTFIVFFFVLSSFLISEILMIAKQKALASGYSYTKTAFAFLLRRVLRIFPAYYFYLVLIMALPVAGLYLREHAGMYFSYLSNFRIYADQSWEATTAHLWTLAVEEQFYIIWPWLILFIPTRFLPRLFYFLIASGILFRVFFLVFHPSAEHESVSAFILTPASLDAFGFGGLLAYWHVNGKTSNPIIIKLFWISFPLWIILKLLHFPILSAGLDRVFAAFFAMVCIEGSSNGYKNYFGKFLESRPVTYLGKISYGIYLYHLLVPILFWRLFFASAAYVPKSMQKYFEHLKQIVALPGVNFVIYLCMTILLASISWYLLELPVNNLKRYIGYSSSGKQKKESDSPVRYSSKTK